MIESNTVECVTRLLDVPEGKLALVVGTIFMDMPLKPNILREITEQIEPQLNVVTFSSPSDVYLLEDESGRIILDLSEVGRSNFVCFTGVIVAVLGIESPNGEFLVKDYCFAELPGPATWTRPSLSSCNTTPTMLAFVSAPNLCAADERAALSLSLCLDWLAIQVHLLLEAPHISSNFFVEDLCPGTRVPRRQSCGTTGTINRVGHVLFKGLQAE